MIPESISRKDILKAIDEIDKKGIPTKRKSTKFQLSFKGKCYPPKYIISIAHMYSSGFELDPQEFSGGDESNKFLIKRGFNIISKKSEKAKKIQEEKPNYVKKEQKAVKHSQHCSECKNTIIEMFRHIYGNVKIEHKTQIKSRLEDYKNESYYQDMVVIYKELQSYKGNQDFVRSKFLQPCDLYIPIPGFIVELDENQHYSIPRKIALTNYPDQLNTGFNVSKLIEKCETINAKDSNPVYRDEQRAWYDTLRDFLPFIKELKPTVRISMADFTWCELDPNKEEDVSKFKSIVFEETATRSEKDRKLKEKIHIATACIQSDRNYTNEKRTELLKKIVESLDDKTDLLLLPAGFYETKDFPKFLYKKVSEEIGKFLHTKNSHLVICLGIDGRYGFDQLGVIITHQGIKALARKFYPTSYEEIERADTYLTLEDGYSRVFELKGRTFYLAVCYDSFGVKKQNLKNPGVDVILNLVHQFNPIGEDISGDVFFARHGFAGASRHWNCPTFGAAVFFDRIIPKGWPTGVIWDCKKENTKHWKYTDNPLSPYKDFIIKANEIVGIKLYEI
ncbi:hypothetical protein RCG17_01075 [Neobacillus sp. PS3-12]|uniref:hypothetical protein n=1 Tax=Neobacillus sp. PS3-12 TaxID=3070677 RepID=UPI0027DEF456|nr:hypothetical protein [Neobacillus sp. PS3-12]WML53329.1 hypothetical protein RCG17_01075 [Neobacillus sp. PS3-12]